MKLKQLIEALSTDSSMHIMLPSGEFVPEHFHITEVAKVTKAFIDCGGTRRDCITCVLQVWTATDYDHRLTTAKLGKIMKLAKSVLGDEDMSVEVEYGLEFATQYKVVDFDMTPKGLLLVLGGKQTDCLAPDKCGIKGCC